MRPQAAAPPTDDALPRVLIVGDHVSARYGGEAILPLHYFRLLRERGFPVWLVTHARSRPELTALFPGETRIVCVEDTALHKAMWQVGRWLPERVAYVTTGFVARTSVQLAQRRLVRQLVARERIRIVHQPVPVSPREPSLIFGVGAPVIIGPMNGGMDYPPSFRRRAGRLEGLFIGAGRRAAAWLNRAMPGKRDAAMLLVANRRTRAALPAGLCRRVEELVENGVELDLWTHTPRVAAAGEVVRFVFAGRLIALKAVDLLLEAFALARASAPMQLVVIGDGEERPALERLAERLCPAGVNGTEIAAVRFTGWVPQTVCANELSEADCLVMPSLRDCGGAVVLEAMSAGLPVIATAWGGPLDYLDASCGLLIAPTDRATLVEGLAQAMVRLAGSPQERSALGHAGHEKIRRLYNWDEKVTRVVGFYREVLEHREPAPAARTALR